MKKALTTLGGAGAVALSLAVSGAGANGSPYSPGLVQGWDGVRASKADVRYVTLGTPSSTVVAAIRVRTGRVLRDRILRGVWGIPIVAYDGTTGGLSGDGKTLVVAAYGPLPGEPGTTRFTVLATKTLRKIRTIELRGSWSFDAISPDAARLYLVEHISAGASPRYRVRVLDVASGRLLPRAVIDRLASKGIMGGQPATRATSSDGRWAYTLYARSTRVPFIHALDTARRLAYCIDLPLTLDPQAQMELRLRLRNGGRELVVRQAGAPVATMSTESLVARAES